MIRKGHVILITLLTMTVWYCDAQTPLEINFPDSSTLTVNKIKLTENMNISNILNLFGKPTRILEYRNSEKSFFYDNDGFIIMTQDSIMKGLGINYNWDGDKKFPEKTFTGVLTMGEVNISKETKKENIDKLKAIGFVCPVDIMCASKSKFAKIKCMVAFKSNLMTQLVFLFK
jgi:hypothetical protein